MVEQLDAMVWHSLTHTDMHACTHHKYTHMCTPYLHTHMPTHAHTCAHTYPTPTWPHIYSHILTPVLTQCGHAHLHKPNTYTRIHTYILCTHAHTRTHTTHTTCMHAPHPTHFVDQSLTFAECTKTKHTTSHTYSYYIAFFNRNN